MKKTILIAIAVCCFALPASVMATPVGSGDWADSRSTGTDGGVDGYGGWSGELNNGFQISWVITEDVDTYYSYHYEYTISGIGGGDLSKSLSHFNLEVTNPAEPDDFDNFFTSDYDPFLDPPTGLGLTIVKEPATLDPDAGNPSMPESMYGIKFDDIGVISKEPKVSIDVLQYTFSFDTWRAPVWGDFYAKDGKDGGDETYAYNTGFGMDPPTDSITGDFTNWIARPNGDTVSVPEPSMLVLIGTCFVGLVGLRNRRKIR